jgi:hypothetical protein
MKQVNVSLQIETSDCGRNCSFHCPFLSITTRKGKKCHLFDEILKEVKVRDVGEKDVYLRCEDCIDHEE